MHDDIYNPNYVKNIFNKMSHSYEKMNYITSFGFSIRWRKQFLQSFTHIHHKAEIIDLLTGMGETWRETKNKIPNSHITALDFSESMLTYAHKKNNEKFNNEITILKQDILNNQLPSNHYDLVTCAFGLKTFNNDQLNILASETHRILKKGGQFSFVEVSKPKNSILKVIYAFYLGKVVPAIGRLFLNNQEDYQMLWQYTNQFENTKSTMELFRKTGLKTHFKSYFYGCATGFYGTK